MAAGLLATVTFRRERMRTAVRQDYANATDLADYLAKKGLPFREAHAVTGRIVLYAIEQKKFLGDLTLTEYRQFSDLIEEDLYAALSPEAVVGGRRSYGGQPRRRWPASWRKPGPAGGEGINQRPPRPPSTVKASREAHRRSPPGPLPGGEQEGTQ